MIKKLPIKSFSIIIKSMLVLFLLFLFCEFCIFLSGTIDSSDFISKIKAEISKNKSNIFLNDVVNFEWDNVCFFYEEDIDFNSQEMIDNIGFKYNKIIGFNHIYNSPYEVLVIMFANKKTEKVKIIGYVNRNFSLEQKLYHIDYDKKCYNKNEKPNFKIIKAKNKFYDYNVTYDKNKKPKLENAEVKNYILNLTSN